VIPSVLAALVLMSPGATTTSSDAPTLSRFKLPWEILVDKTVGTTTKPVRFDWRRTSVHVGAFAAQPAEFNNYNSFRSGVLARIPSDALMYELGLSYVWVFETEASKRLALTPYRQPGRPQRFEIDFSVGVPLAEGVVTVWPSWFPAAELVFSAYFNLRYLIYPSGFEGLSFRNILGSSLSPKISDDEIENLDDNRLPGMEVDRTRYSLYAGLGTDIYFDFGLFVAPRIMLAVPLLAGIAESEMGFSMEFSLALGAAF
jgi:hypothetical protein